MVARARGRAPDVVSVGRPDAGRYADFALQGFFTWRPHVPQHGLFILSW